MWRVFGLEDAFGLIGTSRAIRADRSSPRLNHTIVRGSVPIVCAKLHVVATPFSSKPEIS